jgi:diacylglycerol kinase (ATP)
MRSIHRFEEVLVVANPTSGEGRAGRWANRVVEALEPAGRHVKAFLTGGPGEGAEAARGMQRPDSLILALGGDGTFNEVLNGADLSRCVLGVIPAGTGNVLAKELGLGRHPIHAVQSLLRGRVMPVDVGVCNGRRFAAMFGAGLDGLVVEQAHRGRRRRFSVMNYFPPLVYDLFVPPAWHIRVDIDGDTSIGGLRQLSIGNTHSYGGPMEVTPGAVLNDGLLDVAAMPLSGLDEGVGALAGAMLHSLHLSRYVLYGRARRFRVCSEDGDVPYQVDGEPMGVLPVDIGILPGSLRLLVPPGFRPVKRRPDDRLNIGTGADA